MNRTTRFLIIIGLFIVSFLGGYIYLKKQQSPTSSAIDAIPINTACVIEIKDPKTFLTQLGSENQLWKALCGLNGACELDSIFTILDSLFIYDPIEESLERKSLLISIHETSKNKFSPLFLSKFDNKQGGLGVVDYFSTFYSRKGSVSSSRYNQVKVFTFIPKDETEKSVYFGFVKGVFLASTDEILLQDAIRQTESDDNLFSQPGFTDVLNTSGQNVDANLYIQFKYFKELSHLLFNRSYYRSLGISKFGNWCSLDLNIKKQTILLNGFSTSAGNSEEFASLFQGQIPINMGFQKFVPSGIEGFSALGISNLSLYLSNLKNYMEANGELERYTINQNQILNSFGEKTISKLITIFENELVHVFNPDESSFYLIKTKGNSDAKEFIEDCLQNYAAKQQVSFDYLKKEYKVDKESKYIIYKVPVEFVPTRLFGPWFKRAKAQFVTVYDDYIVFGDSYASLTKYIHDNVLQHTLSYDKDYQQYENYLSSKVNFYTYQSFTGNGNIFSKVLNKKSQQFYDNNQEALRDFYAFSWQFAQEESYLYNNLLFRFQPSDKLKAATEWESRLDTLVGIKPVLVRNHYTKEKEIFIQDKKNTIYLINNAGRILWKKKINGAILGEVKQVDIYKNGKFQYLFNTEDELYVVDRNGNYVEKYPIALPSKAVAPLALFDYDKRKNYRIFIPFEDKKVIAYNIQGKSIAGFKFKGADNPIISPVQYFRISNKDYIIITDESRTYITDRKGNNRISLQKQFDPSPNNQYILQVGNNLRKSRLVRTATDGTIYYIYLDGSVEQTLINPYSAAHYFNVADVTGDLVSDFVFTDENKLEVFNLSGKPIFDFEFTSPIRLSPAFYEFSTKKTYIGVTDEENRQIHLIDKNGKELDGFPLPGKTQFSIGVLKPGSGRFNLIVGGDNQYLYNYKLN